MPDWSLVTRSHVIAALAECDRVGSRDFLSRYRFGRSTAYTLWNGGQEYDSKAILGVAYLHATGTAATRDELAGSVSGGIRVLQGLGFDIVVDEEEREREERQYAARSVPASATTGPTRTSATTKSTWPAKSAKSATSPSTARAKAPAAKTARRKPVEAPVNVCPHCHMAIPATGVCDNCD